MLNRWLRFAAFGLIWSTLQLLLAASAPAAPYTAQEMQGECKELLKSAKLTTDLDSIELEDTFSTGACWGAFLSIQQLVILKTAGEKRPIFGVCVPGDTTLVQLIGLFDSYARAHPGKQTEPFTVVALAALHQAFPCAGEKASRSG